MIRGPGLCGEKRGNPSKRAKKAYRLAKIDKKSAPARQTCRAGAFHRSAPFLYRFRRSAANPNFSAKRQPSPPPLRRIAAQTGAQRNQRERLFLSEIEKVAASIPLAATWRRGRDSNPRVVSHKLISSVRQTWKNHVRRGQYWQFQKHRKALCHNGFRMF